MPGDDSLIEQRGLERGLLPLARPRQGNAVERCRQWFRPHRSSMPDVRRQLSRRDDVHEAEPARIVEGDDSARGHLEDDMVVRTLGVPPASIDAKRPRHSQVHQQRLVRRERHHQVLRTPRDREHVLADEPLPEPFRKGIAQIRGAARSTSVKRACSIAGAMRRRTDSTSGSSGMVSRRRIRVCFYCM